MSKKKDRKPRKPSRSKVRNVTSDVPGQIMAFEMLDKPQQHAVNCAKKYKTACQHRMEIVRKARSPELTAQKNLITAMAECKLTHLRAAGIEVLVTESQTKVKVKDAKGEISEAVEAT